MEATHVIETSVTFNGLHGVISQKIKFFIIMFTRVRTVPHPELLESIARNTTYCLKIYHNRLTIMRCRNDDPIKLVNR
jgi:hypothetical protein